MLLDMAQLYGGTKDTLTFSYTFDPAADSAAVAAAENTDSPESNEALDSMPLVFDGVTFPEPVRVEGKVVNMGGYVLLTENALVTYETSCARCLEPVRGTLTVTLEKPVAEEKGLTALSDKENDDYVQVKDGHLDLDAPVRDEILLDFPIRFFCTEDCRGLCPGCGVNLNKEVCRCRKKAVDPRFSKLSALLETLPDDEDDNSENENKQTK